MKILPVSYNCYNSNKQTFNGKLSDQLVVTVDLAVFSKFRIWGFDTV